MDEGDAPWQTKVQVMGSLNFNVWRLQVAVEGKGSPAVPTPLFLQSSEALTGVLHWNLGTRKTSLPEENGVSPKLRVSCIHFNDLSSKKYGMYNGCTIPSGCSGSLRQSNRT